MTRTELVEQLSFKFSSLQLKDIDMVVRTILDGMSSTLSLGGWVEVRGFGSFGLNYKAPRQGRNPKTGEAVMVPAKYTPHFKPGLELRERVDYPKS
jgi:integration host factor subunit beta